MKTYRLFAALGAALFIIGALGTVLALIALLAAILSRDPIGGIIQAVTALISALVLIALSQAVQVILEMLKLARAQSETLTRLEIKLNNLAANVDTLRETVAPKPLAPTPPAPPQTDAQPAAP